jgi:aldose 1-epimerase
MKIYKQNFGKLADGRTASLFTLVNDLDITVRITNYGGIITHLLVPEQKGRIDDVVAGFETLDGYLAGHPYFGCITGRVANRIGNASFELDGTTYKLAKNTGENHLHGGIIGFDKVLWEAIIFEEAGEVGLILSYLSKDMEEGYPGNLQCHVKYSLDNHNDLRIEYLAETDAPTLINLTNHSYFNLGGFKEPVYVHGLMLNAGSYTELSDELIPTGRILPVDGTPFDFRTSKPIGKHIDQVGIGYDLNFVINKAKGELGLAAHVFEPNSRRRMEVWTSEPGVQLYTANYLDGSLKGKYGLKYQKHHAFCLETQHYPDAPNHPEFPSIVLRPGEQYRQTTIYRFPMHE